MRAHDRVLVLETLFFQDEIRSPGEMVAEVTGVDDSRALQRPAPDGRELTMAVQLVESMTADWDPSRYHDTYRAEVEALIEAKRRGHAVVATESGESPAPVVDLMAALEASVRSVGGGAHDRPARRGGRRDPSTGEAAARARTSRSRRTGRAKAS